MGRMSRARTTHGLLLVVLLAAIGFMLIYVPTKVVELYDRVKGLGPPYVYFYWGMVGTGGAILVVLTSAIVLKLWQATRDKSARLARGAKNPSQLSLQDQEREVADNLASVEALRARTGLPDNVQRQLQSLIARAQEKQTAQKLE